MDSITAITSFLTASGPYGLVAVLGVAFWRLSERKDAELRALYERIVQLAEGQTQAITKVESALVALKAAIDDLRGRR